MPDYLAYISDDSTMMIRDTGSDVEFWFKTGPYTWNNQQNWSYHANGGFSGQREFRLLRGGYWQKFGEVRVTYDQNVTFTIYDEGLGFPTYSFVQHIQRTTVPPAPNLKSVTATSASQIRVIFSSNGTGGAPILEWQIGYGTSSGGPSQTVTSDGDTIVGGFNSGQRVYFWARGRNSRGWSAWSNRRDTTTWRVPDAPNTVSATKISQSSIDVKFADKGNGGTAILERQIGYGLLSSAPELYANAPGGLASITSLSPGAKYYFWARSRNVVGWSPWSLRSQANLIASARIRVDGEWVRAIPYVRVNGEWKVAQPMIKVAGVWKKTSS